MSEHQDHAADPRFDAALRHALEASAQRLARSAPPVAAVVRAGRRRRRLRRAAVAAAVTTAAAALCLTVPLLTAPLPGTPATRDAATGVPVRPAPPASASPSSSAAAGTGPRVVTLGSGSQDGIGWTARVSLDGTTLCQHLTIGSAQVDAPAGYWTDCEPVGASRPGGDMGVHVAGDSGLRLLTTFGTDEVASAVVTFSDGTTAQGRSVRLTGGVAGLVVPIAPGHRIALVDLFGSDGTRLDRQTGFA